MAIGRARRPDACFGIEATIDRTAMLGADQTWAWRAFFVRCPPKGPEPKEEATGL